MCVLCSYSLGVAQLSKSDALWWDLIQYPLKRCPYSRDKWIRSNPIRCFVFILYTHTGICIFTWKCWEFVAKSLSGCSLRNIYKLCCFELRPPSPISPRPYGVTSRNIYDSWLAEDLSVHSSGMAHSVSDSNFSQY